MKKKALITGITGQDGPYLAKLLLEKDYKVYGLLPRRSKQDFYNLDFLGIKNDIEYCVGDITDYNCILKAISEVKHETKSTDPDVKCQAVRKLTYLQMIGYDVNWASFFIIEVMSQPKFTHKHIKFNNQ